MNTITRTLRLRVGEGSIDAWLSRWGCSLGGFTLAALAVAAVRRHAATGVELVAGTVAAAVACLLLLLLGGLARRVHLATEGGRAPWRARRWELASHAAGLAVLGAGGFVLATALPGPAGAVTGGMLALSAYAAVLCLGCRATLPRSSRGGPGTEHASPPRPESA